MEIFLKKKKAANQEILDDADAWVNQLYEGQYVGDYLAKHGYVVLSVDAPMWGERGRKEGVDRNKYDLIAGNMMMLGQDLSAFMTYDDISSTEFPGFAADGGYEAYRMRGVFDGSLSLVDALCLIG